MDKLTHYRNTIVKLLQEYYDLTPRRDREDLARDYLALDKERDCYLWIRSGWKDKKRIQHIIIYLRIERNQIWVEEDSTDLGVVDDLLRANIPQEDIVLGFHHPSQRSLTGFGCATENELVCH
ncbi:MAG: XisI protein [Cyanobacteria bacterium P01_E01_bin.42]